MMHDDEISLVDLVSAFKRRWRMWVSFTLVFFVAGGVLQAHYVKRYTYVQSVRVATQMSGQMLIHPLQSPALMASHFATVLGGQDVLNKPWGELAASVTLKAVGGSRAKEFSVSLDASLAKKQQVEQLMQWLLTAVQAYESPRALQVKGFLNDDLAFHQQQQAVYRKRLDQVAGQIGSADDVIKQVRHASIATQATFVLAHSMSASADQFLQTRLLASERAILSDQQRLKALQAASFQGGLVVSSKPAGLYGAKLWLLVTLLGFFLSLVYVFFASVLSPQSEGEDRDAN
jgi:hypothetical protein